MSGQVIALVAVMAIGVPLLSWALIRDCRAAERKAAVRAFMRTNAAARIAADFEAFARQVGEAFLPVAARMAEAVAEISNAFRPVADWANATDVPTWRRPVVRLWRRHGWRWTR